MKLFYSGLFVLFFAFSAFAQQAVVLESKSLTIPRFDDMAAINAAIPSPNAGMMVYNEQASTFIYFDGSNWISPSGSDWSFIGASIYNNNAGGVLIGDPVNVSDNLFTITEDSARIVLGYQGSFNHTNSGEVIFSEDVTYNEGCGMIFQYNGDMNSLYLLGGCPTLDTLARFPRGGSYSSNLRRLGIGPNIDANIPGARLAVDGTSVFDGDISINGNVSITGSISKGSGTFKIDHPLEPENKYLVHSFVESPEMMNVYSGNVKTGADGLATVALPSYFEAANKDFRYQLTVIGTFAQAIVKEKIKQNSFVVQTSEPGVEVSWQVTGVRADKYAEAHPITVEEEKETKGIYMHPELFGAKPSSSVFVRTQLERTEETASPSHVNADGQ
ncbi:hypothetical protein LAG90_17645 [Marinilongibacter aquaticus]|uniref:hypothetical protein n=1 Tax=Marinilongibacter aquaticus TaxID=2975157 RepID=UPI0021BD6F6A|nr:hypothetical protein [Marinilongibacter aquaticus]UBM58626.1 hypothetical protein LAG90_17645 [Marinilongibacter aquaticus]